MKKLAILLVIICFKTSLLVAQNVGIGTTSPLGRLHVDGGSVIFTGDTGMANITGPGKRLMWMPGKAAFRAGSVHEWFPHAWDEDYIGLYSFASGNSPVASGWASVAFGTDVIAEGDHAFAMGRENSASGNYSFSFGLGGSATGSYAVSLGNNQAQGTSSVALGEFSTASGDYATSIGYNSTAQSYGSLVMGRYNTIIGISSTWVGTDPLLVVGNGTNSDMRSNALTLLKNGNLTIAGNLTELSDARLKKDITTVSNSLEKINALSGYNYYWKNTDIQDDALHAGLMAQEVKEQMPELVRQTEGDVLSVNYSGMIPYLVEAIKELKQLQEESKKQAKADINDLQKENERLRERIKKLEQQRFR